MTEDLREELAKLLAVALRLNSAIHRADAVAHHVEHLLGEELGLGVSAETEAFDEDDVVEDGRAVSVIWSLAYGRIAGRYGLFILQERGELDDAGEWDETIDSTRTPWSACPRDLRLKAFAKLPELIGRITDKALEVAGETEEASRIVGDLVGTMRRPTPRPR